MRGDLTDIAHNHSLPFLENIMIKYISIGFIIVFFTVMTIIGLKNCDKPSTGHSHFHAIKPEDEHRKDYIVKEKLPPHVKREDIKFEVYMGN